MLPTPDSFALVSGMSEGETPLTAFDGALLQAGVGDVNLLKVSSILPPGSTLADQVVLPPGALVPIAYGRIASDRAGQTIARPAVAVGIGEAGRPGVIVEDSLVGTRGEIEARVRAMVREAFAKRGRGEPREIFVRSAEHQVERLGCAFAGVVLWYR